MQNQHPLHALKSSGKSPGLEIWVLRMIKSTRRTLFNSSQPKPETEYEVFPVSPAKQGVFYNQDLYIVLKTGADVNQKHIHFWFGKAYDETPPPWIDKFEDLDLGWNATQHFEFQGYECDLFESYFYKKQPAITYKRGRNPEPYAERVRGDARFYKLDRRDNGQYRVREIPFNIALMTQEECFILDTEYNTRTYVSNKTLPADRNKSIIVANKIRELDHEMTGDVEVVDLNMFSNEAERIAYGKTAKLLEELEPPPPEVDFDKPDEDPASVYVQLFRVAHLSGDDVGYPPRFIYVPKQKRKPNENKSFFSRTKKRISNGFRRIMGYDVKNGIEYEIPSVTDKFVKHVESKPFKRSTLDSTKCYMLEGTPGVGKSVFVWVGKSCDTMCKQELTECLRMEVKRCEPENSDPMNEFEVQKPDPDVYSKKDKIEDRIWPDWTHVIKIVDGNEIVKFKKYFQDWE